MACKQGRIAISDQVKQRLFADSAGYCQKPDCLMNLFVELPSKQFHIAELAHIIAVGKRGPRGKAADTDANSFANLIVLCPNCHTKIDKSPNDFPEGNLLDWKKMHAAKIATTFGVKFYASRQEARQAVKKILDANLAIYELCNPSVIDWRNPESELGQVWLVKMSTQIIPNNQKILMLVDANYVYLKRAEQVILEKFRQHVRDLEAKHVIKEIQTVAARYPNEMTMIFAEVLDNDTAE